MIPWVIAIAIAAYGWSKARNAETLTASAPAPAPASSTPHVPALLPTNDLPVAAPTPMPLSRILPTPMPVQFAPEVHTPLPPEKKPLTPAPAPLWEVHPGIDDFVLKQPKPSTVPWSPNAGGAYKLLGGGAVGGGGIRGGSGKVQL